MYPILPDCAHVAERDNFGPVLVLESPHSRAEIALHGATILSFISEPSSPSSRPLLWLSRRTGSAGGKPIRGGVPLCAPWFGPHRTAATAPMHGLVRTKLWELLRVETLDDGTLRASFELSLPKDCASGWNHDAVASFVVTAGKSLRMELSIRNTGADSFLLSEAMHTYYAVSDVRNVRVEGLENTEYLEFAGDGKRHSHGAGPVVMKGEAANMFYCARPVRIVDEQWGRAIDISSSGAASTVVWNPWESTAAKQADIGEQWPQFICVENANIPDVAVPLRPNTTHHLSAEIAITKL